jgi:alpha-tubulin suppressor-like RCC1 family protein
MFGAEEPCALLAFGRGCDSDVVGAPRTCFASKRLACVAAGWKHSMAVSHAGDVYAWGWGHGITEDSEEPRLVKSLALHRALWQLRFVSVAGGGDFCVAVSENGTVWSWGGNSEGQCGLGLEESARVPRVVLGLHKTNVAQVACGGSHCLARTDAGSLFSWGRGAHGCLGLGDTVSRSAPVRVKVSCV